MITFFLILFFGIITSTIVVLLSVWTVNMQIRMAWDANHIDERMHAFVQAILDKGVKEATFYQKEAQFRKRLNLTSIVVFLILEGIVVWLWWLTMVEFLKNGFPHKGLPNMTIGALRHLHVSHMCT